MLLRLYLLMINGSTPRNIAGEESGHMTTTTGNIGKDIGVGGNFLLMECEWN